MLRPVATRHPLTDAPANQSDELFVGKVALHDLAKLVK